jgi:hypothetical protein
MEAKEMRKHVFFSFREVSRKPNYASEGSKFVSCGSKKKLCFPRNFSFDFFVQTQEKPKSQKNHLKPENA